MNPFQPNILDLRMPTMNDPEEPADSMTTTAQQLVEDQNQPVPKKADVDPKVKKRNDDFRSRADICKIYRRKLIALWTTSIDYRRGKPFTSQSDEDQIAVPLDWIMTNTKHAALFSQVPHARLNHSEDLLPKTTPWAGSFEKKLNDNLIAAGIEAAMDEVLPDCINAAGFGVAMVSYEAMTEDVQVPSIDISQLPPQIGQQVLQSGQFNGQDVPMETVPRVVDKRYLVQRISPADLLWPINFTASNFDSAPWIGRSGRITWAEAVKQFKLTEEDKETVLGEDRPMMDRLTHDVERDRSKADEMVGFDEIFYKEFQYDEESKSFVTIHRLVFIAGKDDPVVDEPWKGQKAGEDGKVLGAQRFPIRVLTFSYITDDAIPPSDSAIGRPLVNEINKSRTQMIHQRERSLPVRWFDVNRVDPAIQQSLMRGTWQAMIPVQGDGSRTIGEVARAAMPPENAAFDALARRDLTEAMALGANQEGSGAQVETKGESNNIQAGYNTKITKDRAKVASFFVSIAEVLAGLMCLYEEPDSLGQGFDPIFSTLLRFSVLADSTVLLDANQKLAKLSSFVNEFAKSGWVNIEPVLQEIAQLSGLDPNTVIRAPSPKPPVEPNVSIRLTGVEDLLNPLSLGMLIKAGQAPSNDQIEQAKAMIQQAVVPPQNAGLSLQPGQPAPGGAPMLPQGAPLPPPVGGPPPGSPLPLPPAPKMGEAHPQWSGMAPINKRTEGGGTQ